MSIDAYVVQRVKTCYKEKLIKTSIIFAQGWRDILIKHNTGFGNSDYICRDLTKQYSKGQLFNRL